MSEVKKSRECIECKRFLPKTEYYFRKHSRAKGGLTYKCKECTFKRRMFTKEGYQICTVCEEELPHNSDYFYVSRGSAKGFFSQCKKCKGNSYAVSGRYGLYNIKWKDLEYVSGIYKITCTGNSKIYIGSATDFCMRWSTHLYDLRRNIHNADYMQNSYNKYGEESFSFEILETVKDAKNLIVTEQKWLDLLTPYDRNIGFNTLKTAGSCLGIKLSEETKDKLSKSLGREMRQYDLDGNLIATFQSANRASKDTNTSKSAINHVANGKRLKERKFIWLYTDSEETVEDRLEKIESSSRKVLQYNLNGELTKEWRMSVKEIADVLGKEFLAIPINVMGRSLSIGGYMWRYREGDNPLIEKIEPYKEQFSNRKRIGNSKRKYNFK